MNFSGGQVNSIATFFPTTPLTPTIMRTGWIVFLTLPILLLILTLNGCSPVPYANVGLNVPMLKQKGEVNLNASYGTTEDAEGFALQTAAAVDSSLSIIASLYIMKNLAHTDWEGKGSYFEFGAGKFGNVSANGKFIYDAHLGLGFGSIRNESGNSSLDVKFIKPFLQGSIGFNHKIIDVALTSRFAVVNFTDNTFRFDDVTYSAEATEFFRDNKTKFVFEPGVTVRVGYEAIRLSLQFCTSTFTVEERFSNSNINSDYFGVGLNALIGRWDD